MNRLAFAENAKAVVLGTERYPIVRTSKRKLRQVDFNFDGKEIHQLGRTFIAYLLA
jgi:hypothetical protein